MSASEALMAYRKSLAESNKGTDKFNLVVSSIKDGLKSFAVGMLNAGIYTAAVWGIGQLITAIDNAVHRSEILIEKGEEARAAIKQAKDEYNSKETFNKNNSDRFLELRQGVNSSTNENISLTNDEYSEYISLCNQIADIYPSVVSSYDSQGNAIINLASNIQDAKEQFQDLLDLEEQQKNYEVKKNLNDSFKEAGEKVKAIEEDKQTYQKKQTDIEKQIDDVQSSKKILDDILNGKTNTVRIEKPNSENPDKYNNQISALSVIEDFLNNNGYNDHSRFSVDDMTGDTLFSLNSDEIATIKENFGNSYQAMLDSLSNERNNLLREASTNNKKKQAEWAKFIPDAIDGGLLTDASYNELPENLQSLISDSLNKVDWESVYNEAGSDFDIGSYIQKNLISPISQAYKYAKEDIDNISNLDTSKLTADEYSEQINASLSNIKKAYEKNDLGDDDFNDFVVKYGFRLEEKDENNNIEYINPVEKAKERILSLVQDDVLKKDVENLSVDAILSINTSLDDGSSTSVEDLIRQANVETAASIANSETFSSVLSGDNNLKESVSNFQNAVSAINEAKQSLETNGQVDNLLDLKTDYPELSNLINQTNDLGEALSKLKTTEATEMLKEFMSDTKNLTGSEKEAANEYLKSVVQGMDWSDVDFSQMTNSLFSSLYESMKDENPEAYSVAKDMTSEFMNQLQSDITSGGFSNAITNNQSMLDGYQNRLTALTDAQKELAESGDLTATSIKTLSDAGISSEKILDGANDGFKDLINSTMDSFDEFAQRVAQGLDAPDASVWLDYCNSIKQANIETADSFTIWQQSLEDANQGARYDSIQGQLKSVEELWDEGWTGTNDWSDFAKMVDQYGVASIENFDGTLEKVKRYITDDTSGLTNFLTDLQSAGLAYQDDNGWVVTAKNYQEMVDSLKVGQGVIEDTMGKLEEQGFHVMYADSVDEATKNVADLNEQLVEQEAEFERLKASGADQTYLDEWQAKINDTKEDLETANDLIDKVVNENVRKVQQYQEAIDNVRNSKDYTDDEKEGIIAALEKQQKDYAEYSGFSVDQALKINVTDVEVTNLQDKIKESLENSDTKDEIQGYLDTLGKYTADELKQINYDDGVYDQINGVDYTEAESAIDALCEHYGIAKDEVLSLIDAITTLNNTETKEPTPTSDSNSGVPLSNTAYQEKVQEVQVVKQEYSDNNGIGNTTLPTLTQGVDRILEKDESKEPAETIEQDVNRTVKTDNSTSDSTSSSSNNEEHVTRIVDEKLGETVETVPDAEGTANFTLGNSPMTVPSASGVANYQLGSYPASLPTLTQNVVINRINGGILSGGGTVNGNAHANGTPRISSARFNNGVVGTIGKARVNGTSGHWGEPEDTVSLVGEVAPELVVRDNHFFTVGNNGAEMVQLKKDDIVFNGKQTKEILENGYTLGRGRVVGGARANGTARGAGGAHGSIGGKGSGGNSSNSSSNSGSSGSTTPSYTKKKASSSKSISTKVSKAIEKISKWVSQHFDWIEVKIDHLQKKADSYYTKAQNAIDLGLDRPGNYKTATSNMQKSIATNEELITANQQGASRYQKEASTVKRKYNKKLKKNDKKVFNEAVETLNAGGTIDISVYSANVKQALEDYKKYYDSAQNCRSAVDDLNSTLIEQKQALFNLPIDQATAKVDKLEVALSKLQLRYAKLTAGKNVKPSVENNELETELKNQEKQVNAKKNAAKTTKSTYEKEQQKVDNAKKSKPQNEAKQKEAEDKVKDQAKDILSNSNLKKVLTKAQKADLKKGKSITLTKKQKRKLNRSQKNKVKAYNNTVKTADIYKSKTAKDLATIKNGNKSLQIAKDANDKAQKEANDAEKDYINQKVENEKTKIDNIDTYYSNRSENEDQKNALKVAQSGRDNPRDISKQIKLGEQKINDKKKQLDNSVDKGIIKIGSKEWYEIWNGILSDETAVENQKIENSKNKFDNAGSKLQDDIDRLDKKQAADIAKSGIDQTADRSAQIKWSKKVLKAKQDQFDKNVRNKTIKEGSDEWYRQQNELYEAQEKLAKEEIENAKGKFDNITSEYGKKKDLTEKKAALNTARSGNENATDYTEQINVTSEELGKMQHKFKEAVNSKAIKEGTDAWYEMQQQIVEVQTELQNLQVESEKTKFKNITGKYGNQLDLLKKNSDRRTASGAYESVRAYDAQISKTTGELKAMRDQLQKSVDSGVIKVGSDAWYEMQSQIVDVETELGNLHESARKAKIDEIFTRAAESVQKLIDRLQTVNGLITDEMKFDKDGNITKNGALSMMLDSKSLEDSKKNFKTYVKERDYILNTSWEAKGYSGSYVRGVDSELDSLLDDVDSKIQTEIGNIQNYTQSLLNTVISANEKERDAILEVVDAHKEALSKKKDYYDYDKKMKSQNKTISDLERQAAGLRGSTDKADIAQLQKIEAQLADAKDERDDMVKDHLYEMQTDALDQISTDINKNYSDMIDAIKASPKAMSEAITQFMKDNGITASGLASSISSVLAEYLDPNGDNKTQTNDDINKSGLDGTSGTTTLSKEQQTKLDAFRKAVKNLGTKYGSSDMDATVEAADKAYAALSSTEKSYVSADYQTLETAKTTHNNQKKQDQQTANLKAFQNAVKNLGTDYGSAAMGKRITTAENAYEKLTPEQKKTVAAQYTTLTTAKKNQKEAIDPNNVASVKTTSKTNNTASKASSTAKTATKDIIASATSTGIATKSTTKNSVGNKATNAVKAATSDVKSVTAVKAKETTNNAKNKVTTVVKDAIAKTNQGNGKINVGDRVSSMQADWVYQYSNKALSKNKKIGSLKRGAPYYIGEYKKNDAFPVHLYSDAARKKSVGWVRKDNLKGYASGTPSVKGDQLAWVNENWQTNGGEIIVRKSDGAMLMPLGNGDTVFSADKVQALYKMLETNPLPMNMGNVFTPRDLTTQIQTVNNTPMNFTVSQNVNVQGDLTRDTLPNLQEILKKSSEYTQNEIRKDLRKNGIKKTYH